MPEIQADFRDYFLRSFISVKERSRRRLVEAAERIAPRLLRELQNRQPIGQNDPLVTGGWSKRPVRPSVRQGLIPIQHGWLPPNVRQVRDGAEISIESRSKHIKFFTMMTGRPYLGTRHSKPVKARRYPYLWFYFNGPVMKRESHPKGFTPTTDFVEDAFKATEKFLRYETGDTVVGELAHVWRSLWTRTRQ